MSSFKEAKVETKVETQANPTFEQVKTWLIFLTPFLAPLGGFVSQWVGEHFPGINVSPGQATDLFLAGIAAVVFAVVTLIIKDVLKGRPLTAIPGELEHFAIGELAKVPDGPAIEQLIEQHMPDIEAVVKSHLPDIEAEIEAKLPTAAADALRQLLGQLGLQQAVQTTPVPPAQAAATTVPPAQAAAPQQPAGVR